jgi:hypothetical protein
MRDTPVVAGDADMLGALLPSRCFLRSVVSPGSAGGCHGGGETQQGNGE